jgi:CDP-glucose 4,6-dehydratase
LEGMEMNQAFWHDKKVFITGHTGFKGSWLSLWLQKLGAEVTGYSLQPPTTPNLFDLAKVGRGMTSLQGDVRDFEKLRTALKSHKPEIVIHMAAQAIVRHSYKNPIDTFTTNVMGTVNLLESVRHCDNVHAVLCVTSDKCYENREWIWGYRENDAMGGHDPYSCSKGCSELVTAAYRNSFFSNSSKAQHGIALASARAGNVIGGGDWAPDRLVPDIIRALLEQRLVVIRYPKSIRPWQHVLEPLCGYLTLLQKLIDFESDFAEGWNFGPRDQDARSVRWIVERLAALWGTEATWKYDETEQLHESHYLKLDCTKAMERLGWEPKLTLSQALEWTVEWSRGFQLQENLYTLTQAQISRYEGLITE